MPTIENARLMLRRDTVAQGRMGPILAAFLVEHLPFLQDDHLAIMDTVAVLLHSGCLDEAALASVWNRGKRVNSHYVAFLEWRRVPVPATASIEGNQGLPELRGSGGQIAEKLAEALSARGRVFIEAAMEVLARPETQEVVSRCLNAIGRYFQVAASGQEQADVARLIERFPGLAPAVQAIAALARVDESLTSPVFARSTAIGSLMRRKIEPLTAPVQEHLRTLLDTRIS
jgi:hypothetical protein